MSDPRPLAIVSDFDGTITTADIGDEICKSLAPEMFSEFERRWRAGEWTLAQAQDWLWPQVCATEERIAAIVRRVARFRPGFEDLLEGAASRDVPFFVASGGFSNYIDPVLARAARKPRAVFACRLVFDGGRASILPVDRARFGCPSCNVCKGRVVDKVRASGFRVAYMGDGASDRCAAGHADLLFAVAGSSFERHLVESGLPHSRFASFGEVRARLGW